MEYIKNDKEKEIDPEYKKFKENIMEVKDLINPEYKFFMEYNEFTKQNNNQYFSIDEGRVIDYFNITHYSTHKKQAMASRVMYLLSTVFYLEPEKISRNIKSLP